MQNMLRAMSDPKIDALSKVPLFSRLSKHELEFMATRTDEAEVPAGKVLTRQGRPGDTFYVLLGGEAKVVIDGNLRRTLQTGDFFGEVRGNGNISRLGVQLEVDVDSVTGSHACISADLVADTEHEFAAHDGDSAAVGEAVDGGANRWPLARSEGGHHLRRNFDPRGGLSSRQNLGPKSHRGLSLRGLRSWRLERHRKSLWIVRQLREAKLVPERVPESAVDPVEVLCRLGSELDPARLEGFVRLAAVVGGQAEREARGAFGDELADLFRSLFVHRRRARLLEEH